MPARAVSPKASAQRASDRPARPFPDFAHEQGLFAKGAHRIAGIDEAGRGPLAGPVVAAAVILDPARIPAGLDDSKRLSAQRRERLFAEIVATATVAFSAASAAEIDRVNIRVATLNAMRRALAGLETRPCHALIDGRDVPDALACPATSLVGGDGLSVSIAAASIVAKVMRDRLMQRACDTYPGYGFSAHAGYGTKTHLDAIARLGPSPIHRLSFRPLRR